MNDLDQFLGRDRARIVMRRCGIDHMLPDMILDHLGDEPVERAAARGRLCRTRVHSRSCSIARSKRGSVSIASSFVGQRARVLVSEAACREALQIMGIRSILAGKLQFAVGALDVHVGGCDIRRVTLLRPLNYRIAWPVESPCSRLGSSLFEMPPDSCR